MVRGATKWLSRRLAALLRPRSSLGAFVLPAEIILMVTDYLTKPSVISLALTCRYLGSVCFPHSPGLSTAEKEELLQLLEKDIASLYFCHYCTKLHPWNKRWSNSIMSPDEKLPCAESLILDGVRLPESLDIQYNHARLVMNRHLYGRAHGLTLHSLEHTYCFQLPTLEHRISPWPIEASVAKTVSLHARILDDKLLVLSISKISHPRGKSEKLRDHIHDRDHDYICHHISLNRLPEVAQRLSAPGRFARIVKSCSFCLTDCCIDISWRGRMKGYMIKIRTYRLLGDCRSPFHWSWRTRVDRPYYCRFNKVQTRKEFPLEYGPGVIRDRWNEADGIESRTRAEWV